jgi:hypothetical protein
MRENTFGLPEAEFFSESLHRSLPLSFFSRKSRNAIKIISKHAPRVIQDLRRGVTVRPRDIGNVARNQLVGRVVGRAPISTTV